MDLLKVPMPVTRIILPEGMRWTTNRAINGLKKNEQVIPLTVNMRGMVVVARLDTPDTPHEGPQGHHIKMEEFNWSAHPMNGEPGAPPATQPTTPTGPTKAARDGSKGSA